MDTGSNNGGRRERLMRDSTIISPAPARKNTFIDRGPGLRIFQNKIKMACMATSKTVVYGIILLLIFLREIQPEYRYIPYWLPVSVPVPRGYPSAGTRAYSAAEGSPCPAAVVTAFSKVNSLCSQHCRQDSLAAADRPR